MRPRPTSPSVFALVPFLILLLAGGALAQDTRNDGAESSEPTTEEVVQPAEPRWHSPRDTISFFLENMRDGRLGEARLAFDDQGVTPSFVEEAARRLYDALNRIALIRPRDFPGVEDVPSQLRGRYEWRGTPRGHPEIQAWVGFVRLDSGEWRLSHESMQGSAELWEQVRHLPVVDALLNELGVLERFQMRLRSRLPDPFLSRGFILENWQWLGLVALIFLAVVIDRLMRVLVALLVRRATKDDSMDEGVLVNFERPTGLLAGALFFELMLPVLGLQPGVRAALELASGFVATIAGVWAAYRLVDVLCDHLKRRAAATSNRFDDMLVPLVRRTLKIFVVVVGLVFIASRWTDDLWGLLAGLGLGSIAVGFAAKDSIENLFGTFTVLMDKPFSIGDWIVLDGLEGTVEEVGFRSTRIRTFYDSRISVPNRTFISSSIDNMGARRYRRIRTVLSLTYDTPAEKIEAFCEGVRQLIRSHPSTRKDYYHVYLNQFGPSSLDVLLYCFVAVPDWGTELRERHRLFADILRLAEQLEVDFAFPTQTLHMARPEDLEHPDRPADDPAGAVLGRRTADRVAETSLAPHGGIGKVPPPVKIQRNPVRDEPPAG